MNFILHFILLCLLAFCTGVLGNTAVLLVDPQITFYERGSLAVPGANSSIFIEFVKKLYVLGYPLVATQDSHPTNHSSFSLWPTHGLKNGKWNSRGEFEGDDLVEPLPKMVDFIVKKGESLAVDSYSGFKDENGHKTGLASYLRKKDYRTLIVLGEAGNFCVKATVIDALTEQFNVVLVSDMTHYIPNTLEIESLTRHEIEKYGIYADFKTVSSQEILNNPVEATKFPSYDDDKSC